MIAGIFVYELSGEEVAKLNADYKKLIVRDTVDELYVINKDMKITEFDMYFQFWDLGILEKDQLNEKFILFKIEPYSPPLFEEVSQGGIRFILDQLKVDDILKLYKYDYETLTSHIPSESGYLIVSANGGIDHNTGEGWCEYYLDRVLSDIEVGTKKENKCS